MLIVALNGSPKKNGNTAFLLNRALQIAGELGAETELIHVAEVLKDVKIPFCHQCSTPCRGVCARNNRLGKALDLLREADGLILGSPVYFGTVSGQIKAFWDKTRILRAENTLLNLPGVAVSVGASRFGGQENTLTTLYHMMLVQGMTVLGDGFGGDCGHHGVCAQRPAVEDLEAIKRLELITNRLVQVASVVARLRSSELNREVL